MKPWAKTIGVLLGLALVGSAGAWYFTRPDTASTYKTALVRRADIVSTISATGTVVPEDVVDVGTQVNGQIATFGKDTDGKTIDYRSAIDEGAVLATIDDALYAADVATSKAQYEQAQAQVRLGEANRQQAAAKLDQAKRDWDRAQSLGQQSEALAQTDYDAARSAYEQAVAGLAVTEASIGQARASVSMAEASLQRSQRNLAYCIIKSPVKGVIIDKRVDIGQTVVASFNAPSLFLIAKDLRRMQVLVQVNEADVGNVTPGQAVSFLVDAYPSESFKGEVRKVRLNATMTQNVVTYTVEIVTENSDLRLLPYLTANVSFIVARHDQVLAVPNAALRWSPRTAGTPATTRAGSPDTATTGAKGGKGATSGESGKSVDASKGAEGAKGAKSGEGGRGGRGNGSGAGQGGGPTVWILADGKPRAVPVRTGLSDGILTEVESPDLPEGAEVIIGEQTATSASTPASGPSPFTPQLNRGQRGGR